MLYQEFLMKLIVQPIQVVYMSILSFSIHLKLEGWTQ